MLLSKAIYKLWHLSVKTCRYVLAYQHWPYFFASKTEMCSAFPLIEVVSHWPVCSSDAFLHNFKLATSFSHTWLCNRFHSYMYAFGRHFYPLHWKDCIHSTSSCFPWESNPLHYSWKFTNNERPSLGHPSWRFLPRHCHETKYSLTCHFSTIS